MNLQSGRWERVVWALSFANLVYLRVWFDLMAPPLAGLPHAKYVAQPRDYVAALGSVFLLAGAVWWLMRLAPRLRAGWQQLLVAAGVVMVGNAVRGVVFLHTGLAGVWFRNAGPRAILVGSLLAFLLGASLALFRFRVALVLARGVLDSCFPAFVVTLGLAAIGIVVPKPERTDPPLARMNNARHGDGVRVLWVIFDEWDYRLSFVSPLHGVMLPAVHGVAARAMTGSQVLSPQGRQPLNELATQIAIPSLLAGELRKPDDFSGANIFGRVHEAGWNVAVGGWHIPYCQLFARDVARCYWDERYTQSTMRSNSLASALLIQNRSLFETSLFSVFGQPVASEEHAAEYRQILDFILDAEADPRLGLVFAHFNIPHKPFFYDARTGRFDAPGRGADGYADALVLMDQTVDQLVTHLDSKTVLLLSADHPLRDPQAAGDGHGDSRVPFLLHFPGQTTAVNEEREFTTTGTADLILEILNGQVKNAEEAADFMVSGRRGAEGTAPLTN